ncbi:MAG: serine--tRNA ligase [Flavobacteriaceae bacterium]|nr:serine--tRNA ligase [Flavobacteriaceae bacterium]|tara:strand:- start:349 stop:1617 length:1269 start_codon:yes stop_codon:yes gene_type:complete
MIPLQFLRDNKEKIISKLSKRNFKNFEIINTIISLDETCRKIQVKLDNELSNANNINKQIGLLFKNKKHLEVSELKEKSIIIKSKAKELQNELKQNREKLLNLRTQVPNIPDEKVSPGTSEIDNEEVYKNDKITSLESSALPHWELAEKNKIIDFELGNKITGSGFPVYIGKGAKLQRALINYLLDKNISAGYNEFQVPHVVNEDSGFATGQLPDKEGQMYHINNENLYLIPTAEVPLTNIYRNKLLSYNDLPISMTSYTPCFRREAGSYGSDVRGLNRLHQFDKVEIVRIEEPQNSSKALDIMVNHVKKILNELELPYRILKLCGGDLGFASSITYDFEIYSAAQKKWLEISSVSNFKDFQSERLKLRYKNKKGEKKLLHTLNGSSLALPRLMAGLIENNQVSETIKIPKKLIPYTGFDKI